MSSFYGGTTPADLEKFEAAYQILIKDPARTYKQALREIGCSVTAKEQFTDWINTHHRHVILNLRKELGLPRFYRAQKKPLSAHPT